MGSRKGKKNKTTLVIEDVKRHVIRDGMQANAQRFEALKDTNPYLYLRTIDKLLKL